MVCLMYLKVLNENACFHHEISKVNERYIRGLYLYSRMETLPYFMLEVQYDNVTGLRSLRILKFGDFEEPQPSKSQAKLLCYQGGDR